MNKKDNSKNHSNHLVLFCAEEMKYRTLLLSVKEKETGDKDNYESNTNDSSAVAQVVNMC